METRETDRQRVSIHGDGVRGSVSIETASGGEYSWRQHQGVSIHGDRVKESVSIETESVSMETERDRKSALGLN